MPNMHTILSPCQVVVNILEWFGYSILNKCFELNKLKRSIQQSPEKMIKISIKILRQFLSTKSAYYSHFRIIMCP